jgi:hypothetical protein
MGISKDIPLSEITLRRYEKPYNMSKRDLIRKLCLSVGLLQPGDSRDIIVDILYILYDAKKKNIFLDSEEIRKKVLELRKKQGLPLNGVASSNIRRQIRRLRELFIVEKVKNNYRINEFDDLDVVFDERIRKIYLENILNRVKDYFKALK